MDYTTLIQPTLIFAGIVFTNLATYFISRKKNNNDAFSNLISANEKFRNEIRGDLMASKQEAQMYKDLVNELKEKINEYESQIIELKTSILEYKEIRSDYEREIQELRDRLNEKSE